MEIASLDGEHLGLALRSGIQRVLASQEHLNKINVFPVPDGDTGTNLGLTLGAVLAAIRETGGTHAGELLLKIADAAIDGARGNSGAILAQFFVGLADQLGSQATFDLRAFAAGFAQGERYAREALSEPREGTLLTVLSAFSEELTRLVVDGAAGNFGELFSRALPRAQAALEDTRNQLEVLRRANVVDAGAQGFYELVRGMADYLTTGVAPHDAIEVRHDEAEAAGAEIDLADRFCTECVITGTDIDRRRLREQLAELGSGVVVAGTHAKTRIHVHVREPGRVFRLAARFGTVSAQKADDMQKQQGAAHHRRRRGVAVVVDSAADIPEEEVERLEIHTIPLRVHFGERSYLDKVSMSQEEFYRELESNPAHPKTSQPPPGDFRRIFEFLASHYDTVLSINLTARVSGTRAAAESAAARVQAHGKVVVLDSLNASLGQGLVAMYAAECAQAGRNGAQVVAATEAIRLKTCTFGLLKRLDFAVRGGRVPAFIKMLADVLHITPILVNRRNGEIGTGNVLLGRHSLRQRFARLIRRRLHAGRRYRVAVGHAHAEDEGRMLLEEICRGLDNIHSRYLAPLGTALGVHGGPGMLVVAIQEYEPP